MLYTCVCESVSSGAAAKSLQSCPTLCDPTDSSPPGSPRLQDSPGKNTGVGCHFLLQCMKAKSESEVSPTLSDPMDCSLPGSSVHGILQARVLEWGAIARLTETVGTQVFSSSPLILNRAKDKSHWQKFMAITAERDQPKVNTLPLNYLSPNVPLYLQISNTVRVEL